MPTLINTSASNSMAFQRMTTMFHNGVYKGNSYYIHKNRITGKTEMYKHYPSMLFHFIINVLDCVYKTLSEVREPQQLLNDHFDDAILLTSSKHRSICYC